MLIDGAIAAIAENGMGATSIKEITEIAGLSNGTFYNHFQGRDEIFELAAYSVAKEITDEIAEMVAVVQDGIGRIVISTDAFIGRAVAAPDWGALLVNAVHHIRDMRFDIGEHLRADVALAIEQGKLSEMPSSFLVHQIGALITLAVELQIAGKADRAISFETCEAVLKLLGLTPTKAHRAVQTFLSKTTV